MRYFNKQKQPASGKSSDNPEKSIVTHKGKNSKLEEKLAELMRIPEVKAEDLARSTGSGPRFC